MINPHSTTPPPLHTSCVPRLDSAAMWTGRRRKARAHHHVVRDRPAASTASSIAIPPPQYPLKARQPRCRRQTCVLIVRLPGGCDRSATVSARRRRRPPPQYSLKARQPRCRRQTCVLTRSSAGGLRSQRDSVCPALSAGSSAASATVPDGNGDGVGAAAPAQRVLVHSHPPEDVGLKVVACRSDVGGWGRSGSALPRRHARHDARPQDATGASAISARHRRILPRLESAARRQVGPPEGRGFILTSTSREDCRPSVGLW